MAYISSTSESKHYGKQGGQIYPDKGKQAKGKQASSGEKAKQTLDHLNLSPSAKLLMSEVEEQFQALFEEYPEYKSYLMQEQKEANALQFIAQSKKFLNEEAFSQIAKDNPNFSEFYEKVKALSALHREALEEAQKQSRSQSTVSYSPSRSPYLSI